MVEEKIKSELKILFDTLCDGLRQEVRQRSLAHLATGRDFSITNEREVGIASLLALHLRSLGFAVQLDAYIKDGDPKQRPDFGIWLPAGKEYIYLELKLAGWGQGWQYYYQGARNDIKKLDSVTSKQNPRNGLIALGFSKLQERQGYRLQDGFENLSQYITGNYPYKKIGLERIDLQDMDKRTFYAMIGLWFREVKELEDK